MTLTSDQKHALILGGGVLAVALLYWWSSQNTIVPGTAPAEVANAAVPGYTDFNVQPLTQSPLIPPGSYRYNPPGDIGCGCSSGNDGCFTSAIDSGQSPVSMQAAMLSYQAQNPQFYQAFLDQLKVYQIAG